MDGEKPNLDELRRRRLAWLSGSRKPSTDKEDDNVLPPPRKRAKESPSKSSVQPETKVDSKEVIDLCDDSEEDEKSVSLLDDEDAVVVPTLKAAFSSKAGAIQTRTLATTTTDKSQWISSGGCFQACTYNLWFGPQRDGSPHASARMKGVVDLLVKQHSLQNPLWFVGFQEVVEPLSKTLFPLMRKANYKVIEQPFEQVSFLPYGVALAIRQGNDGTPNPEILRQGWMPFTKTDMSRGFLHAHCSIPSPQGNEECLVTTTHLESWTPQNDGAQTRAIQAKELQNYCMDQFEKFPKLKTAIIMGDLNWDDERRNPTDQPLLQLLSEWGKKCYITGRWKDAWQETNRNAKDKGYTYDAKLNAMLGGNLRRRFDRFMVFRRDGANVLRDTLLIGQETLPNLTWPKLNTYTQTVRQVPTVCSDHFGLVTQLSLSTT